MNDETAIVPTHNKGGDPDEHLCYMMSQGFHITDEQDYHTLTADPKFRCGHCNKQAASGRSLCVPIEL